MAEDDTKIADLERKIEWLTRNLDEVRRHCQLAPLLDAQVIAINARSSRGSAA